VQVFNSYAVKIDVNKSKLIIMKNSKTLVLVMSVLFFAFASFNASAQRGQCCAKQQMVQKNDCSKVIPNLSEDQKAKIDKLRTDHLDAVKPLREKMKANREMRRKLMSADKQDQVAINANIDEHAKLQAQIMKLKTKHISSVRSLLTDEQKVAYDAHHAKNRKADCCMGAKKGMKHRKGKMMQ